MKLNQEQVSTYKYLLPVQFIPTISFINDYIYIKAIVENPKNVFIKEI